MSHKEHASFLDSTVRLKWEVTKEKFDSCEFDKNIKSPNFIVQIGNERSEWRICLFPRGNDKDNKNQVAIYLGLMKGNVVCDVMFGFGVKTNNGYWPHGDLVEKQYSNKKVIDSEDTSEMYCTFNGEGSDWAVLSTFCTTDDINEKFVENKLTLVATLVFHMEGKDYLQKKEVADYFVEDLRSLSLRENLSDVTIICSGKKFPSYKVLLAARSKYFEALFKHEPQKKEVKIEESSPDIVEALLDFVSQGLIPDDINAKAEDLIELADMYRVELLSQVCLSSMVNNLSPSNALQNLITVDKLKHICKSEKRDEILKFIKKEAAIIFKGEDWEHFVVNYPSLVTEIVRSISGCSS